MTVGTMRVGTLHLIRRYTQHSKIGVVPPPPSPVAGQAGSSRGLLTLKQGTSTVCSVVSHTNQFPHHSKQRCLGGGMQEEKPGGRFLNVKGQSQELRPTYRYIFWLKWFFGLDVSLDIIRYYWLRADTICLRVPLAYLFSYMAT
jgi:hypothetical protein